MSNDGDEMKALVIDECGDKMRKAVTHLQSEFAALRTGRASSSVVEKLRVDAYGSDVPLQQLAGFGVPEQAAVALDRYRRAARQDLDAEPFALGQDDRAVEETVRRVGHHDHSLGTR